MMSDKDLRALIVCQFVAGDRSYDPVYKAEIENRVRILLAVLNGGDLPPETGLAPDYLRAAQIPFELEGDSTIFKRDWLEAHGFVVTKDNRTFTHPKFSPWFSEHEGL